MMRFRRKALWMKVEVTYGTDAVPVAGTDGLLVRNLKVTPLNLGYARRELVRTFFANEGQIVNGQWATLEFEVELAGAGTAADTVPKYDAALRGCALAKTVNAGVSVQYDPISSVEESVTAYFLIDGRQHKMLGMRGTMGIRIRAGEIPVYTFKFTGLHVQPTDAALSATTQTGFQKPLAVNNANTTPFTLHSYAGKFREFTFEQNNQISYRNLVNSESVVITGRQPTGKVTLESELVATKDWWTIMKAETTGALAITHGTVAFNKVQIDAPNVQVTTPDESEEDGVLMLSAGLEFKSGASGNDEIRIRTL